MSRQTVTHDGVAAHSAHSIGLRRRTAWKFTRTNTIRLDAIKRFFVENGKALVVGVILGVGALVGWRYWNNHQADPARRRVTVL